MTFKKSSQSMELPAAKGRNQQTCVTEYDIFFVLEINSFSTARLFWKKARNLVKRAKNSVKSTIPNREEWENLLAVSVFGS